MIVSALPGQTVNGSGTAARKRKRGQRCEVCAVILYEHCFRVTEKGANSGGDGVASQQTTAATRSRYQAATIQLSPSVEHRHSS